jgi:predicted DNA-binding transcriptional regulator YafY
MSVNERFYQIDQLLNDRRSVSFKELQDRLEVSPATLKRDLAYMRDRLNAPIVFDKELGGYRFEKQAIGTQYELPGLWFSAEEIHALLTMQHLLAGLDTGGLLGPHIKPLLSRLVALLGTADNSVEQVKNRIKVETVGARRFHLDHFQAIGSALLRRKRLVVDYHARGTDQVTRREISPQRIIYYRDNWYLDGWCHLRNSLRSFSVDAIKRAEILEKKAEDISERKLNDVLGSGYGIFSGKEVEWAVLQFSPEKARWVASEKWHSQQKSKFLSDGTYELRVPYSDPRELIMDILRHGSEVKVISPDELKAAVISEAEKLIKGYQ